MTWEELEEVIRNMPKDEKKQTVQVEVDNGIRTILYVIMEPSAILKAEEEYQEDEY